MQQRYERLYSLPGQLYIVGSPVIVDAGALLKDNQYNSAVAQLKFRSISNHVIKAISIKIFALDTAQRPLGDPVFFQYLDLNAKRDDTFGQDIPVNLPDPATRVFYVSIQEVIFDNNKIWQSGENVWQSLPAAVPLSDFFKDFELMKQFKIHYGADCSVCPVQISDLWYCTCGKINHIDESLCHSCAKNAYELFHIDLSSLTREKDARLQKEAWEKQLADQKAAAERAQKEAQKQIEMERLKKEREIAAKSARSKKIKMIVIIIILLLLLGLVHFVIKPAYKYSAAEKKYSMGEYEAAISGYNELGNYKDSSEKIKKSFYAQGIELFKRKEYQKAYAAFLGADSYADTLDYINLLKKTFVGIAAGGQHTVGLKADGTVLAIGANEDGQCNVSDWRNIVSIDASEYGGTMGLRSDGTVVMTGDRAFGLDKVSDWNNIAKIAFGGMHAVGLREDGTVVAVGNNDDKQCRVSGWNDIIAIAAGNEHTVGLKSNGTVVATGLNKYGQCNVTEWKDIVKIAAGSYLTVGLKSNGTVVIAGDTTIEKDVSDWEKIIEIDAGFETIVGLKSDGTVVFGGWLDKDKSNELSKWKDIVTITEGLFHTVGLKKDGTVIATGVCDDGECDVDDWNNQIY